MATITLTSSSWCAGNGHFTLTVSGAKSAVFEQFGAAEIRDYDPTNEEIRKAIRVILAIWAANKTNAQAKTQLDAGVTITI